MQLLGLATENPIRMLVLGAHPDDIEIGCGGTILRMILDHRLAEVRWVVMSGDERRSAEARAGASAILAAVPSVVDVLQFRDGYFPYEGQEIKETFEAIKSSFVPDLILTHRRDDLHQDHALVAQLTSQTFRDHLILEYEVPKWDADLQAPNLYVPLPAAIARRKASLIGEVFTSQAGRHWFTDETFLGLARLRGIECRAPEGYAEGFHARKLVW
jgi:LmbE family N-acetylglucosaminyl deacetylase